MISRVLDYNSYFILQFLIIAKVELKLQRGSYADKPFIFYATSLSAYSLPFKIHYIPHSAGLWTVAIKATAVSSSFSSFCLLLNMSQIWSTMVCLPRKQASKVSFVSVHSPFAAERREFYNTYSRAAAAAAAVAATGKTVGHDVPLTLPNGNSLGWPQTPVPAAPAAPASMWAGLCPFSTFIRKSLLGQEGLRCHQAALVFYLQNEKGIMALVGHLMAQTWPAVSWLVV